jgi:hypothetical protein
MKPTLRRMRAPLAEDLESTFASARESVRLISETVRHEAREYAAQGDARIMAASAANRRELDTARLAIAQRTDASTRGMAQFCTRLDATAAFLRRNGGPP